MQDELFIKTCLTSSQTRIDVVLVDTAGRMQDNEPLMRSLAKLIKVNSPDLVLFVGEALVGNDAIDQLTKFNQSLADFSQVNVHSSQMDPYSMAMGMIWLVCWLVNMHTEVFKLEGGGGGSGSTSMEN